jgi:hypothetical protein
MASTPEFAKVEREINRRVMSENSPFFMVDEGLM